MSLVGKFRNMLPAARNGTQWRFARTPLVEKLVPDEERRDSTPQGTLAERLSEWQYTLPDFYQQRRVSLLKGVQHTYQQVRTPGARLRARRAQKWLGVNHELRSKKSTFGLTERQVDRNLSMLVGVIGLDVLGKLFFPPLSLLTIPVILFTMYPVVKLAWLHIARHRKPDVSFMVCLTTVAMFCTGYYSLSVLSALVNQIAFKLQFRIQDDSQHRLVQVFKQQPRFVYTLVDGVELRTPFANIRRGDVIVVHTGETIPVDGIVVAGAASVDQHLLTGESQPVEKGCGEEVFAATVVLTGWLHIEAEKASEETMVAQIGQILNKTIRDKTDMQMRADIMANKTVIPTLALGLASLPFLGPVAAAAIVAAHFGLRMSIVAPLVVLNYFRLLSHHQILVKDGHTLDHLRDIDTVVFDKTGTLTQEQPHVGRIYAWQGVAESDVLAWAAAAEYKQAHPIALAILEEARQRQVAIPEINDVAYAVGYGLTVSIGERHIKVGSHRFMQQAAIPMTPDMHAVEEAAHQQGHSLVLVACDNRMVGAIELVPTIRPETRQVIAGLRQRGIKHIAIISGDREAPTRKLAAELGVDQYFAETLPQHKAEIIEHLQQTGHSVCFVGDGINDAIALKKAHVSVSMRGASTVATDTAQIVLIDGGLGHLCQLFDFAQDFDRTMKASFVLLLIPSIIGMSGVFVLGYGLVQAIWFKQLSLALGVTGAMEPLARLAMESRRSSPTLPAAQPRPLLPAEHPAEAALPHDQEPEPTEAEEAEVV